MSIQILTIFCLQAVVSGTCGAFTEAVVTVSVPVEVV